MRFLNRLYAWFFGYFWLPCPVCRENFGGHEASWSALVVDEADGQHAYCTCSKVACQEEATRRNMERGPFAAPLPSRYVNGAGILASDMPHEVVRKLDDAATRGANRWK